jgi:hypothetical protein
MRADTAVQTDWQAVHAVLSDARRHDRKAFELPSDRRGVLWIADRGYSDHTLFLWAHGAEILAGLLEARRRAGT